MRLKNTTSSISFKTLIYLIIFSITILLFLYFSQNIILKYSYEKYQERKIRNLAKTVQDYEIEEAFKKLELVIYDNEVCAQYIVDNNTLSYNTLMVGCEL